MKLATEYTYSNSMRLFVITPIGAKFIINTPNEACQLLPFEARQFWMSGSGSAEIRYYLNPDNYHSLTVMCRPHIGYYVTHSLFCNEVHVPNSTYVAVIGTDFTTKTSLWVGGDFFLFPTSAFLSTELFRYVVECFCDNGGKSIAVIWAQHPLDVSEDEIYGIGY